MAYSVPKQLQTATVAECYQTMVPIAPADATPIAAGPFCALYVGVAGDVQLCPRNSVTPVIFKAVPAGTVLRVAFQGVDATNTTATNMVGLA